MVKLLDINPKDIIFALDIGTRSIIGTVGVVRDKKFHVLSEKYLEHEERAMVDGQIHDVSLVASTVSTVKKDLEEELGFKLKEVSIAAAGRFLRTAEVKVEMETDEDKEIDKDTIRSLELNAVKKAEEDINKQTQGKLYCVGYSVKNYYLNGYVIGNLLSQKGEKIAVEVISTFLPRSVVDSLYAVMNKVFLTVTNLTLEPIAAIEAVVPKKLRLLNIALVDVGAGTSDIAISSNESISAYGMVPMAGDEVTEAIVQAYLVDFITAERMKREISVKEKISYVDILGLENEVTSAELIKITNPIVDKITKEVGDKIIELNGGKSPNAIFLVGGGAHTPNFKELLAEKLNLPIQRIAIKGRDAVIDASNCDESLGSTGVTVLGIAIVAIKKSGNDFIDVILNNEVISLFNSHRHTVMDVMVQASINHKMLVGKNGKNIRFTLNGIKRVAFGTLAQNAEIKVNNKISSMDTEVKEGDSINIIFAKDGKDAAPRIIDFVKKIYSIGFYFNDIIQNLEPVAFINKKMISLEELIKEDEEVEVVFPSKLGEYLKYNDLMKENTTYFLRDEQISEEYVIKEGDRIYSRVEEKMDSHESIEAAEEENYINEESSQSKEGVTKEEAVTENHKGINVIVNDDKILLTGKDKYIFIDIFNYINFDLTSIRGILRLILNGEKAGYYDELKEGDIIKVFWDKF
ncbi:cell division protein FtsA [Clostridium homopropionicum DSM 5847]|uniref:Cell division protein FtsA n=1 Tax=Clostridium homopropionicum DSM 5847 TaxID=1121318 RepID=A0A0L6ZEH7_9CLOT|nr:cell division protein FtsA [Clostridium homopropionicum]KOA21380.1 cell division protein FtsA [Clostridium homopropionicum DSM 5847]SFG11781.1 cell division protein FtsA [Clostridium homopropionicum]